MKNMIILALVLFSFQGNSFAQKSIDAVLAEIERNNLTLQAVKKAGEAENLHNSTGLTLENPQVNYDFMVGRPVGAGNQTDIVVSQSFDFPSVYANKKELSFEKNKLNDLNYQLDRQLILFDAKSICMDQIYRNKLHNQFLVRKNSLELLVANYQQKMEKGEGTIIEVKKAQLQLIELNKEMEFNRSIIRQNNAKLSSLNGGNTIELKDTIYPIFQISPSFEAYFSEVTEKDPQLQMANQQNAIAIKQIELSKSITLPKFELGYHYQGILGQQFNGVHAAMTIPLWEHKNTIKAAQASSVAIDSEKEAYKNERFHELKNTYERHQILSSTLEQYKSIFSTFSNTDLLLKALDFGEISTIEYFMELSYYYTNYDHYLETEKELNLTLVELLRFKL